MALAKSGYPKNIAERISCHFNCKGTKPNAGSLQLLNDNQIQMFRLLLILVLSIAFIHYFGQNNWVGNH
jgi:hypothetical protein